MEGNQDGKIFRFDPEVLDLLLKQQAARQASLYAGILGKRTVALTVSNAFPMTEFGSKPSNVQALAERAHHRFKTLRPDKKNKDLAITELTRRTLISAINAVNQKSRESQSNGSIPLEIVSGCCDASDCPLLDFNACVVTEINAMFGK